MQTSQHAEYKDGEWNCKYCGQLVNLGSSHWDDCEGYWNWIESNFLFSPEHIRPAPDSGVGQDPSSDPFLILPEEREAVKIAMEMLARYLDNYPVIAIHEKSHADTLRSVITRFKTPTA